MNIIQEIFKTQMEGVEWKELGEVSEVGTGKSNGNEAIDDGEFPFFVRSKFVKYLNSYEFDEEAIIIPGEGGIGEIFHYINGKYALHQRAYRIHILEENISTKFVYYFMKNFFKDFIMKFAVSATVTSIRKPMIEKFKIPIPSFEIQKEIVRILDNFTSLQVELQAELQERKEQYNYYLNDLLTPKNPVIWEERRLQEICKKISSGGTPLTSNKNFYGGNIPWLRTQEVNFCEIFDTEIKITEDGLNNSSAKYIAENSVIVAMYGATVGKVAINKIPLTTNQACCNLELNNDLVNYKFIYYWFVNNYDYIKSLGQGTQTNINSQIIRNLVIKYPKDLKIQQKIVDVLDNFEKICSDLNIGLPAEIEARQKQYEYYREKLLTFDGKMTQYFINNLANKTSFDKLTSGQADKLTSGQADKLTSGQADKLTSGQASRME